MNFKEEGQRHKWIIVDGPFGGWNKHEKKKTGKRWIGMHESIFIFFMKIMK